MTKYPDIAGSDEFGVEVLRNMIPDYIYKGSAETRTSTTTFADDSVLVVPVEANTSVHVRFAIFAGAILAEDIKTMWSVPSGTSGVRRVLGPGSAASDGSADDIAMRDGIHQFGTSVTYSGVRNSNTNLFFIEEEAIVVVGSTAGNVGFQWAQATSGTTGTTVGAYSFAWYRRIA